MTALKAQVQEVGDLAPVAQAQLLAGSRVRASSNPVARELATRLGLLSQYQPTIGSKVGLGDLSIFS